MDFIHSLSEVLSKATSVDELLKSFYGDDFLDQIGKDLEIVENDLRGLKFVLPGLFFKYARFESDFLYAKEHYKTELNSLEGSLSLDVRNDPDSYGVPKITDASVNAAVNSNSDFILASNKYNLVSATYKLLYRVMRAFIVKADMIRQEEAKENAEMRMTTNEIDKVMSEDFKRMRKEGE